MVLYLINAATDAKRQPCLDMTEASIWDLSEAKVQVDSRKLEVCSVILTIDGRKDPVTVCC